MYSQNTIQRGSSSHRTCYSCTPVSVLWSGFLLPALWMHGLARARSRKCWAEEGQRLRNKGKRNSEDLASITERVKGSAAVQQTQYMPPSHPGAEREESRQITQWPVHAARKTPQLHQQEFRRSADSGMSSRTIRQAHGAWRVVQQGLSEAAWMQRSLQGLVKVQRYQRSHVNWKELHERKRIHTVYTSYRLPAPWTSLAGTGGGQSWPGSDADEAGPPSLPPSSNGSLMPFFFFLNDHYSY